MKSADKNTSVFPQGDSSHAEVQRCGAGGPRSVAAAIDRKSWKRVRLGEVCKLCRGVRVVRSQLSQGRYLVYQNSLIPLGHYDKCNAPANTTFVIAAGSAGEIGYCDEPFWAADDCFVLLPNENVVSKFLYYSLATQHQHISGLVRRGSVPRLARDIVGNLVLRLPDMAEQDKIIGALTSIDTHISAIESLIAKYEAIKKATVNLLLKPKEDWKQVKLGVVFDLKVGGDLDLSHYSPYKTNDCRYEIVSNSLANHGHYGYTSLPKFPSDSITVTGRGNVGHAEYRQEPFGAIVRIVILSPKCNHVCAKFVAELINGSESFQIESTGVPQLTAPQIASTAIALPSIDEQKRIIAILDSIDGTISGLKSKLAKTQDIKQGMMSHFFG